MTNADKYDELIAREPTLEGKARLIRAKSLMSPCVAHREYDIPAIDDAPMSPTISREQYGERVSRVLREPANADNR